MVSAQISGTYKIYVQSPRGARRLVKSAFSYWWGPGGSPDGAIANTPEKWNNLELSPIVGGSGYQIVLTIVSGAAKTTDASDGVMQIPCFVNGELTYFGNDDAAGGVGNDSFTVDQSPADVAFVAGSEAVYQILRAKEGVSFQIGGGRCFWSIEDNTA